MVTKGQIQQWANLQTFRVQRDQCSWTAHGHILCCEWKHENVTRRRRRTRAWKSWNRKIAHVVLNTHIHTLTRAHRCTSDDFIALAFSETQRCPDCVLSHVRWYLQAAAVQRRGCCCYNRPSVGLQLLHQRWNWRWKTEQRLKSLLKASGKFNVHLNFYPSPPSAAQPISSSCLQSLSSCRPQFPLLGSRDW